MPKVAPMNLPPEEAIKWFQAKGYKIGFDWRDVWKEEHRNAFTVAKAMNQDILVDIRQELDKVLAEGTTLAEFRSNLEPTLQRKGWWERKRMVDPKTGEIVKAQLGSPRRLRIIFDTNVKQAYNAGSWERFERNKERRPFLEYHSVLDGRERPEHAEWHGIIRPVDDPFWQTHTPMNGWGCRCRLVSRSERELKRQGKKVTSTPEIKTRAWLNKRTGKTVRVPEGIDPGFDFNIGAKGRRIESLSRAARESQVKFNQVMKGKDFPLLNKMTPDEAVALGKQRLGEILDGTSAEIGGKQIRLRSAIKRLGNKALSDDDSRAMAASFKHRLHSLLAERRGTRRVTAATIEKGRGAELVRDASTYFPDEWIKGINKFGNLSVRHSPRGRGWHRTLKSGKGEIAVRNLQNAIHELTHRIQSVFPELDAIFQSEHRRRTAGDPLKRLKDLKPMLNYTPKEKAREDAYINPYTGREYKEHDGALEVMTMAMEILLAPDVATANRALNDMLNRDRRLVEIALGALFHWTAKK